jgi:hypothetical protein
VRLRTVDSVLLGCGLTLLASSRPLEGLIFSVPIVAVLLLSINRTSRSRTETILRTLIPASLILIVACTALLYYFWRVTGSPFRTPYQVNLETQDPVPLFPWQSIRQAQPTDMSMIFSNAELEQYDFVRNHFLLSSTIRGIQFYLFFIGPVLTLPFLFSWRRAAWEPRFRLLIMIFVVSTIGALLPIYFGPSYIAPLTCAIYLLLSLGLQHIRRWTWRNKTVGVALVRAVPVVTCLMFALRLAAPLSGVPRLKAAPLTWCSPHLFEESSREHVRAALESTPGLQLALVRYPKDQLQPVDWVANSAEINQQRVIWANDLGAKQNLQLIEYFRGRQVWLVEPSKRDPISPYNEKQ